MPYDDNYDRIEEWVRRACALFARVCDEGGHACPICHGISERDGGRGHTADCEWERVRQHAVRAGVLPKGSRR